jgi:hypothetical protein
LYLTTEAAEKSSWRHLSRVTNAMELIPTNMEEENTRKNIQAPNQNFSTLLTHSLVAFQAGLEEISFHHLATLGLVSMTLFPAAGSSAPYGR